MYKQQTSANRMYRSWPSKSTNCTNLSQTRNTVSNAHKMIPPLPHVLNGKVLVLLWETPKSSILLKEETDFIEPQILWNHTKSEIFVIHVWRIGYSVLYFLNLFLKHFFSTENGNFCENIQIRRRLSFRVLMRSRNRVAQSTYIPIEDRRHCTL